MRHRLASLLVLVALIGSTAITAGCAENDIKTVRQTETVHESAPQPVEPGEPVVE